MANPRKFSAEVLDVVRHTPGVYTIRMRPHIHAPRFRAGQFLHLALDPYDPSSHWPESRVFSIANSPTRRDELRITFAVKGAFTSRMEAELAAGGKVWVKMPFGDFAVEPQTDRETVLIAGGTGITPFVSFLESACDEGCASPIRLLYGVRSTAHLTYWHTVSEAAGKLEDFRYRLFMEEPDASMEEVLEGRLDLHRILQSIDDPATATFYLSGPPAMVRGFGGELAERGVPPENIKIDDWG